MTIDLSITQDDQDEADYDGRYTFSIDPKVRQALAVKTNDAFVKAMTDAIRHGKEKATFGVTVDTSPPINAKRLRGDPPMSVCGSPAAMCIESAHQQAGAETLKA